VRFKAFDYIVAKKEGEFMNLEERVKQLEFQIQLLFRNTSIDRYFFETNVTKEQYLDILDYMDVIRTKIGAGEEVHHRTFEAEIYNIVPEYNGNYHFCESITQLFAENHDWEEVFPALYGNMPKHGGEIE